MVLVAYSDYASGRFLYDFWICGADRVIYRSFPTGPEQASGVMGEYHDDNGVGYAFYFFSSGEVCKGLWTAAKLWRKTES